MPARKQHKIIKGIPNKHCSKCCKWLLLDEFQKSKRNWDGLKSKCTDCRKIKNAEYYAKNKNNPEFKERKKLINKKTKLKNKESIRQKTKIRQRAFRLKYPEIVKRWKQRDYRRNKESYIIRASNRRAAKYNRTPDWLTEIDLSYINDLYKQSKELQRLDGIKRHVDHIIPLQGETVSGLHVPWNLQILTATENLQKGNNFTC